MRLALQIYSMNFGNRRVSLDEQEVRIGRTPKAELTVPDDPHISGVHFLIYREEGQVLLKDLQSRNGTFVNGARVGSEIELHDGDVIVAGKTQFQVILGDATPGSDAPQDHSSIIAPPPAPSSISPQTSFPLEYEHTESIAPENNPYYQAASKSSLDSEAVPNYPRLSSNTFKNARRNAGLGSDFVDERSSESAPVKDAAVVPDGQTYVPSSATPGSVPNAEEVSDPHVPQRSFSVSEKPLGKPIRYESRMAPSGMTYFCPRNEVQPPIDVADFIGQNRFLYAIANYGRLQPQQQPAFYHEAVAAGGVQISSTQMMIPKRDAAVFHGLLRQAWGQDAIICVASRLNKLEFTSLAHRLTNELASPAELLHRLYSDEQYQNFGFLEGISAILLEIERGSRWVIFKNDQEIRTWRTLGLPCPPELIG